MMQSVIYRDMLESSRLQAEAEVREQVVVEV
jgi:hypothetical protein